MIEIFSEEFSKNSALAIYLGTFVTIVFCLAVCFAPLSQHKNGSHLIHGPQTIHTYPTPRIGGLGVFIALWLQALFMSGDSVHFAFAVLMGVTPVFCFGFAEDITNFISPSIRLLASLFAGFGFCVFTGVWITNVDLSWANKILTISGVGIFFTALAIAALSNAFNIIDGLNGLSIGTALMIALTIAILASLQSDDVVLLLSVCLASTLTGIFLFNFPLGKIFIGDGGAYLMGAMIASLAVLLSERNEGVSPFASALLVSYPFYELLRSFLRRLIVSDGAPMQPDNKHLHSLMFSYIRRRIRLKAVFSNSLASCVILLLPIMSCIWALRYFDDRDKLVIGILLLILAYETAMRVLRKKLS